MSNIFYDDVFANFNIIYRTGGHFYMPAGTDWRRQNILFEQNKFYFISHGFCNITIEDKEFTGAPGDWFFIPSYTPHSYYNDSSQPYGLYSVHFDLYPKMNLIKQLGIDYKVVSTEDSDSFVFFSKLASICNSEYLCDKIELKSCLFHLMNEFLKLSDQGKIVVSSKNNSGLNKVLAYINENFHENITNTQLADMCHMHLNHFTRFFREKIGETPQRYVTNKRIDAAKQLLDQTDLPLSTIAESVGFYDCSHFSKCFKNIFGMAPFHYREYVRAKHRQELERTKYYQETVHKKTKKAK